MRRPLVASLSVALAARVAVLAWLPAAPAWDGAIYARLAAHLAAGLGYVDSPSITAPLGPTAFYPVGYPAALAALLPFVPDVRFAAWGVNLLAALAATAAAVTLGSHLAGRRGAWASGLGYALYPGAALWTAATMTETLTGALLAASCALTVARRDRPRWPRALASGVVLGAATLVRPQSLLLAPLVGLRGPGKLAPRLLGAALATLAALAVVAPWTVRNCRALGACVLVSTNGGSNLLIGTLPEARGGYRPAPREPCHHERREVLRDRCMSRAALARIRERPVAWLALAGQKLARTFAHEVDPASYARATAPGGLSRATVVALAAVCVACWWALVALSSRGAWALWSRGGPEARETVALLGGGAAAVALTHAVFLGADRYHLALIPLLTPLASGALSRRGAPSP